MTSTKVHLSTLCILTVLASSSCVSLRVYEDLEQKYKNEKESNSTLVENLQNETNAKLQLVYQLEKKTTDLDSLEQVYTLLDNKHTRLNKNHKNIKESYDFLLENNTSMLTQNIQKNRELLEELEKIRKLLDAKEEALLKEAARLEKVKVQIEEKERKIVELESIISEKDSIMTEVDRGLSDELVSYKERGLSIIKKNGKLYLSLENQLLFRSGSWVMNSEGKKTVQKIAKILEKQKDLNILVEGHTDDVKFTSKKTLRNNWDLSVMRATSIVQIMLTSSSINPKRLIPVGRGSSVPLVSNTTPENRRKNRRIEIIIEPDLSRATNRDEDTLDRL